MLAYESSGQIIQALFKCMKHYHTFWLWLAIFRQCSVRR